MNNQRFSQKITLYDIVLTVSILIVAMVLYWVFELNTQKSPDDNVVVRQDGVVILQLTPEELNRDGIYDFKFDKGIGYIEVKDKRVRMLPMNKDICPEAICSNTGWINGYPKTIVCMPNRLIVSFTNNKNGDIDGIAY